MAALQKICRRVSLTSFATRDGFDLGRQRLRPQLIVAKDPPDALVADSLCAVFGEFVMYAPIATRRVFSDHGDDPPLEKRILAPVEWPMVALAIVGSFSIDSRFHLYFLEAP